MRNSQWIGAAFAVLVIISCYLPWVYIPGADLLLSGMDTGDTRFGKPGKAQIFLDAWVIFLFFIPKVWAKRINMFMAAFALSWAVRNFILFSRCEMAICPVRQTGIWILVISSTIVLLMTLLPKVKFGDKI
jgi:hypothetical protein